VTVLESNTMLYGQTYIVYILITYIRILKSSKPIVMSVCFLTITLCKSSVGFSYCE